MYLFNTNAETYMCAELQKFSKEQNGLLIGFYGLLAQLV
jgi:hypothetical protein